MLNSFRAVGELCATVHSPILAGVVDHAGLLLVGMWLVLGLHALLRAVA